MIVALPSFAEASLFTKGPVFKDHGANAIVAGGIVLPESQKFKVVFDISDENETDKPHKGFDSVARFINMHARAGVPLENIEAAMVIHGGASNDLLLSEAFKARFDRQQPSSGLLADLQKAGVRVILCGQSAAFRGIDKSELAEGVEMSLSAMTANALLQQQGYTLNPF